LSVIQTVQLTQGKTGEPIEANLVRLNAQHVEDYDRLWQATIWKFSEEDKIMSWRFKEQLTLRQARYEAYAIEAEGVTQGMMLIETENRRSLFTPSQRLVYVESLASAPWNRSWIKRPPTLKGVGKSLLSFAKQRSASLGYGGFVGLHALSRSIRFYERMGMTRLELEPKEIIDPDENVPYFEYIGQRPPQEEQYDDEY
jgi:GNAT superfamily N-acetyltransferase